MADEHPTFVTTMAALAEPRLTESSNEKPWYMELQIPPLKASPAPVGLNCLNEYYLPIYAKILFAIFCINF